MSEASEADRKGGSNCANGGAVSAVAGGVLPLSEPSEDMSHSSREQAEGFRGSVLVVN